MAKGGLIVRPPSQAPPPEEIIFRANFTTPGVDFGYNFPIPLFDDMLIPTHLPTGAYNGGPACLMTAPEGALCNGSGGWGIDNHPAWEDFCQNKVNGTRLYVRLTYQEPVGNIWDRYANKMMDIGEDTARTIIWQEQAPKSDRDYGLGATGYTPVDYGFDPSVTTWDHASVVDKFISITMSQGTSTNGAGPILIGDTADPNPGGLAFPPSGVYHIQFELRYGTSGTAAYKIWSNNNVFASPTRSKTTGFALDHTDPRTRFMLGSSAFGDDGDSMDTDISWIFSRFEAGTTFDPTWFPG
jgi:hypothetical protein